MPKDDREILHGITFHAEKGDKKGASRTTYVSGMEDELASVATDEQLKAWVEAGDIKGTWKSTAKKEAKK
jgi:hypothetical protein